MHPNWMQCITIFISAHSRQCINERAWIWISEPFNVIFLIDYTILLHVMEDVHKRGYQTQVIKTLVMKGLMPLGSTEQTSSLSLNRVSCESIAHKNGLLLLLGTEQKSIYWVNLMVYWQWRPKADFKPLNVQ